MWRALANQVLRLLVIFVGAWAVLFVMSRWSCAELKREEMAPTVKSGFKLLTRIRDRNDFQELDVVLYEIMPPGVMGDSDERWAARVRGLPGGRAMVPFRIWTHMSEESQEIEIPIPRDCLLLLIDQQEPFHKADSQTLGPIGQWAVVGRIRRGGK